MTRRPKKRLAARKPARKAVNKRIRPERQAKPHALDPWLPAVRSHLEVTLRHGALVVGFPLPDETDPAPVFEA